MQCQFLDDNDMQTEFLTADTVRLLILTNDYNSVMPLYL